MTDKPKSQVKLVCGCFHQEIDADELLKPTTTPLDPTYRERAPRCPDVTERCSSCPKEINLPTEF